MLKDPDNLPELNIRVILIGIALSVVMGSANVYLGLKAGMTVCINTSCCNWNAYTSIFQHIFQKF